MNISEIKIRKVYSEGALKAIMSIVVDECLAVHEIKVIQESDRLFVAMPSREDENGVFRDIVHPICSEAREQLEDAVLLAYESFIKGAEKGGYTI